MADLFPLVRDTTSKIIFVSGRDPGIVSQAVMTLGYFVAGARAAPSAEHIVPLEPYALGHITRAVLPPGHWDTENEALQRIFPVDRVDSYTVRLTHGVGALRVWYAVRALRLAPPDSIVVFPLVELGLHPQDLEAVLGLLKTTADTSRVKLLCSTLTPGTPRFAPPDPSDPLRPAFILWLKHAGFTPVSSEAFLKHLAGLTTP
jgi:hypothetical protein